MCVLKLHIPLHRGVDDHPTLVATDEMEKKATGNGVQEGHRGDRTRILGTMASEI